MLSSKHSGTHQLNQQCKVLSIFERKIKHYREAAPISFQHKIDIIYGYGRHGEHIAKMLEEENKTVLGVDFDPYRVKHCQQRRRRVRYGDAEDIEFIKSLPLDEVKVIMSTIPHLEANHMLVSSLREAGYKGKIALSAFHEHEIAVFKKLKPDLLLVPYQDAARQAAEALYLLL